jgi:hypothetical protein
MERFLWRMAIATASLIALIVFLIVAIAFLTGALYLFLCSIPLTRPAAALIVGLVGLGLAALIALVVRLVSRRGAAFPLGRVASSGASHDSSNIKDIAARLAGLTAQEMVSLVRAHPHRAVIVSLIAGLAVGLSAEIRNILKAVVHR